LARIGSTPPSASTGASDMLPNTLPITKNAKVTSMRPEPPPAV
jgi:hypothetical protein